MSAHPGDLTPDRAQLAAFVSIMFKRARHDGFVALRSFIEGSKDEGAILTEWIRIGDPVFLDIVYERARQAATWNKPAVFCPPVATFKTNKNAKTENLYEGVALSVECDQSPQEARRILIAIIGEPTVTAESGGEWDNPDTFETEPKVHLHWRLKKPTATKAEHDLLKEARRLATELVGGDATSIPIVHPFRWPGSVHRKGEPRLARTAAWSENEIDLAEAIERLREASGTAARHGEQQHGDFWEWMREAHRRTPNPAAVTSALSVIPNVDRDWAGWNYFGMAIWGATGGSEPGREAFATWSAKSPKNDPQATEARWRHYTTSPPTRVGFGTLVFWARHYSPGWRYASAESGNGAGPGNTAGGGNGAGSGNTASGSGAGSGGTTADAALDPVFDPWQRYIVPEFPVDVLPPAARDFCCAQSEVIGCDPAGLAMSVLATFSGSLHHGHALRMLRNGSWWASPRLWVLLVGPPSCKKTPIFNTATEPLLKYECRLREKYEQELRLFEKAREAGDESVQEPEKPPRYVVWDTTVEALGEILSRSDDKGLLVKSDEIAGFLASMERYSNSAGRSDRAFWLQAYDGGPHAVDRIKRGELFIKNLSASIIGGIQPERLAEIRAGLSTDGLLQRFLPAMLRSPTFPLDRPSLDEAYDALVRQLIFARPARLIMTDDALVAMGALRKHIFDLEQVSSGLAAGFDSFVGKLPGICGSLALILHLAHDPKLGSTYAVGEHTVQNVRRLVLDFILPHALEFYRGAAGTTGDRLQRIASWILTSRATRVLASDLTRKVRDCRGLSLFDLNKLVAPLVACGWLQAADQTIVCKSWQVNPQVHVQLAARAKEEEERKAALGKLMGAAWPGRG